MDLLAHQPVVELLSTERGSRWFSCLQFSLGAVSRCLEVLESDSARASRASPVPAGLLIAPNQRTIGREMPESLHDLLECIMSLVSAPNAPLGSKAEGISTTCLRLLRLRKLHAKSVRLLFEIITVILTRTEADNLTLAAQVSRDIIPEIIHCWQLPTATKRDDFANLVKDSMIRTIFAAHLHLLQQVSRSGNEDILETVRELADTLGSEYGRRSSDSKLQLEDIVLSSPPLPPSAFQTRAFALTPYTLEGERRWAFLQVLALVESIVWRASHRRKVPQSHEQPRKRRKLSAPTSKILENLVLPNADVQLAAIHLIPFFLAATDLYPNDILELVHDLIPLISNKKSPTSNWAMVALSRCVPI